MGDKGGWAWLSRKNFDKKFFLQVLDYTDSDTTNKTKGSSPRYSLTGIMF